jgi:hypothetical protein
VSDAIVAGSNSPKAMKRKLAALTALVGSVALFCLFAVVVVVSMLIDEWRQR